MMIGVCAIKNFISNIYKHFVLIFLFQAYSSYHICTAAFFHTLTKAKAHITQVNHPIPLA